MIKLKKNYLIKLIFIFNICIIIQSNFNQIIASELKIKKNFDEISKELRCMTCQNLSIYESDTEFSNLIKNQILAQLKEKKSKAEIIEFMVDRYGEYILLDTRFNKKTLFLWLLPFVLLLASFGVFLLKISKKQNN